MVDFRLFLKSLYCKEINMEIKKFSQEEILEARERIVAEAKKLKGIPFRHMGVTRFGLDCKGCGWMAYHRAGIDLPQSDGKIYEPNWFLFANHERYLDAILRFFEFTDTPQPGDIVTFKCFGASIVTHGGIYIKDDKFIHAPSGHKVREDSFVRHKYWKKSFFKFMVYRGFIE